MVETNMKWALSKLETIKPQKIDDTENAFIIENLSNSLNLFVLSKSNFEKVQHLEICYFHLKFGIDQVEANKNNDKSGLILKIAILNLPNLFQFIIQFRIFSDFLDETDQTFISAEFLIDIQAILDSLLG